MPPGTISVTRPGKWGNPFTVGLWFKKCTANWSVWTCGDPPHFGNEVVKDLDHSLTLFRDYAAQRARRDRSWLAPLEGYDLACWCPEDSRCHAAILLRLANPMLMAYRAAKILNAGQSLDGYCVEASVTMLEYLNRHNLKAGLVRRRVGNDGHWTIKFEDREYDPTCAEWGSAAPEGSTPGQLYEVVSTSPHHNWPYMRIDLKAAYEISGIQQRIGGR